MAILRGLLNQILFRPRPVPLLILDMAFPSPLSAYRYAEFKHYLTHIPGSLVLSTLPGFDQHHAYFAAQHPALAPQVRPFSAEAPLPPSKLVYSVFLSTAHAFLPYVERHALPLAMTLYPGGDFGIDDAESDAKLAQLFAYEQLRKVIVTQVATLEYLKAKGFYDAERVEMIYGAVIPGEYFGAAPAKQRFGLDKPTLDLCFVAYKYMPLGRDKGYDSFIAAAHAIAQRVPEARFHVVGNYGPEDLDVSAIAGAIRFHGIKQTPEFPAFYAGMDLIISPNIPHLLGGGKTDGFPTAACMEASLSGVGLMCADVMRQNIYYADGTEICIVPPDADAIAERVLHYRGDAEALARLGELGRARSQALFDPAIQLGARLDILQKLIRD
jgi:lipopolysaccharide transport system ATP-binding protein